MNTNKILLNDNNLIPIIGLGTWNSENNTAGDAVEYAIKKANYEHIDCASIYGNEVEIGNSFSKIFNSKIKRQEIFITSKLWNTEHKAENVEKACRKSLQNLKLDYLDLYLVHWGLPFISGKNLEPIDKTGKVKLEKVSMKDTWTAMEELVAKGLVKSIGVANFSTPMLVDLLTYSNVKPVMNQIELHPYNSQRELVNYCEYLNIAVTAYSPLGTPASSPKESPILLEDKFIVEIAHKYKKSSAQILLRWGIQRNTIVIPKSTNKERIKSNISIFDFELQKDEMDEINNLNKNLRYVDPKDFWGIPYFC